MFGTSFFDDDKFKQVKNSLKINNPINLSKQFAMEKWWNVEWGAMEHDIEVLRRSLTCWRPTQMMS